MCYIVVEAVQAVKAFALVRNPLPVIFGCRSATPLSDVRLALAMTLCQCRFTPSYPIKPPRPSKPPSASALSTEGSTLAMRLIERRTQSGHQWGMGGRV
eukprot:2992997-Rhodomonas_salina.2